MKGATHDFSEQIRAAFRDPQAVVGLFKQLTNGQKRAMLETLRERAAEFAREFLAALYQKRPNTGVQPRGWRARVSEAAKRLRRLPPEQHVFRDPIDVRRAGVLTGGAGERYLSAVAVRDSVRRHVARQVGLSEEVTLAEVREELSTRNAAAEAQRAEALRRRNTLRAPAVQELERAFLDLRPEDRQRVIRAVPITHLIPKALRLVRGLANGPVPERGGRDI